MVLIIFAIFAPLIAPKDPEKNNLRHRNYPPVWQDADMDATEINAGREPGSYFLGADALGRDVFSRIIYGARISLMVAAIAIAAGVTIGSTLGLIAGYFGGVIDEAIMRLLDVNSAIPFILLALMIVIVMGQSLMTLIVVLALSNWSGPARLVRGQALQLKTMDYVHLSRISGGSNTRIIIKHILPGTRNVIVVVGTLEVGSVILAESILSYLGAGVPPPTPAWGSMISDGREYLLVGSAWWITVFPGIAIFLTVLAFNFLGDWLRDKWDPRLRQL
ncbi:MAG: ABC transporter permease [Dehalococcoidia bacterium]|nr:ABC transporter permease [Dehalococcoidia bacterium]